MSFSGFVDRREEGVDLLRDVRSAVHEDETGDPVGGVGTVLRSAVISPLSESLRIP